MPERERYHSFIASSDRWEGFALRPDDVVVTTPSKAGTTWMQALAVMLVHDGLPDRPVHEVSPWLDMNTRPRDEVHALLAAQDHRRVIKTHTPLDGLPWHDEVDWITVARDPRDVFVSMLAHMDNLDRDVVLRRRTAAVGVADLDDLPRRWPDTDDRRELVAAFLELPRGRNSGDMCLAHLLHHLRLAWEARRGPNVHLFHYADLLADLPGELARLARLLGVPLAPDRCAELAQLATFDRMRGRAVQHAPEATLGVWRDPTAFFRAGRHGDGAATMTAAELARYDERVSELAGDADFVAWVHAGRLATGVDVGDPTG